MSIDNVEFENNFYNGFQSIAALTYGVSKYQLPEKQLNKRRDELIIQFAKFIKNKNTADKTRALLNNMRLEFENRNDIREKDKILNLADELIETSIKRAQRINNKAKARNWFEQQNKNKDNGHIKIVSLDNNVISAKFSDKLISNPTKEQKQNAIRASNNLDRLIELRNKGEIIIAVAPTVMKEIERMKPEDGYDRAEDVYQEMEDFILFDLQPKIFPEDEEIERLGVEYSKGENGFLKDVKHANDREIMAYGSKYADALISYDWDDMLNPDRQEQLYEKNLENAIDFKLEHANMEILGVEELLVRHDLEFQKTSQATQQIKAEQSGISITK
jgi:hypothetical protein